MVIALCQFSSSSDPLNGHFHQHPLPPPPSSSAITDKRDEEIWCYIRTYYKIVHCRRSEFFARDEKSDKKVRRGSGRGENNKCVGDLLSTKAVLGIEQTGDKMQTADYTDSKTKIATAFPSPFRVLLPVSALADT